MKHPKNYRGYTLPSHTLLFGHCDLHAYNTEQSERNDQWIFGDVWWELYPTEPPTEGKLRWMYGVGGSWKGWWELGGGMEVAFTPNRTHIDWPGGPIYIKCVLGNTQYSQKNFHLLGSTWRTNLKLLRGQGVCCQGFVWRLIYNQSAAAVCQ